MGVERGSLQPPSSAPVSGELVEVLSEGPGWRVEQILSGTLPQPVDDLLDHEEWVVVLAGAAVVEIDAASQTMRPGDWLRIGRGIAHRVLSADPGTSWLAVHLPAAGPREDDRRVGRSK
jgi:cupin 2 domain-containing protein